jgi:outer membrane protein assembly factor BamC
VPVLTLKDDFERGWRRVGLSLDRLGFTVQDRDRKAGTYYVRYVNPGEPSKDTSLLSKLAFWDTSVPPGKAKDYRISVVSASEGTTQVSVVGADGKPDTTEAATRILTVLQEDLK